MKTSEQIDKISEALAKAQGSMQNPDKDCTAKIPMKAGGSYSYNYAGLPSILDSCRKALSENGIAHSAALLKESASTPEQEREYLEMRLLHLSGQWIESRYELPILTDPKARAAEITYGRRYLLTALIGVAADEDTDEKPENGVSYAKRESSAPPPVQPQNKWSPTEAQLKRLHAVVSASGWTNADAKKFLKERYKIETSKELNRMQYEEFVEYVQKHPISDAAEVDPNFDAQDGCVK